MHIKNKYIKGLSRLFIIILVLECIYLFAAPVIIENYVFKNIIEKIINNNTSADISYSSVKIKTHLKPDITIKFDDLIIKDKENGSEIINTHNINADISLISLINRKIHFSRINADDLNLSVIRDKNGKYNIEKLFSNTEKNKFKLNYKNTVLNIKNSKISSVDEIINKNVEIECNPFIVKSNKKSMFNIITKGNINSDDGSSDFDINMTTNYPFTKKIGNNSISGSCLLYNINLKPFLPFINNYIDKNITDLNGFIEFVQLSANKDKKGKTTVILNTKFKDFIFNKSDWENNINAYGENKLNAGIELYNNIVDIKSMNYKSDNINIKSNGIINIENKPVLDINVEVKNSRAEDIVSILPPNLVKRNMLIAKIKNYGVFGDVECKLNIKGEIPQPDITGYVTAKNVKILDKSFHSSHDGTINIIFDRRILNMDILINLANNQRAKINGSVYMYREGINDVTIKTTDNIDFPLAQKLVVPISKVFNFQLGPIPDMNITSGKGIIDINIKGSPDIININGYSSFDKANLTYNGLYAEIKNAKGRLDFKEDFIKFNSERAFVKNNPVHVDGTVQINNHLDFNIESNQAEAEDLLELINKSELLKDVKDGLVLISEAKGNSQVFVNIKAKIVPVPYGEPPLPPDEAFEDMKVKGSLNLLGNKCAIEGFKIPVENIRGIVDFTETTVNIRDIEGVSGTSPITIGGKIITDMNTKIPDVDLTITGKSINLKDTIKFLTESYLYPQNYPDLSFLYNIASKHDLYFKYKAKSIDFLTNKAYAEMNFITDETNSELKAKKGKIVLDKANLKVENVCADLFDSDLYIYGDVQKIDTINPIYNLTIKSDNFNLKNLNNIKQINSLPTQIENIFDEFNDYEGISDINIEIKKNILNGNIFVNKAKFKHIKTNIPFVFDDLDIIINNNKITLENIAANIAQMPFFGDMTIDNIFKKPDFKGFFTIKIKNDFIQNYLPSEISSRLILSGDINLSSKFSGNYDNINLQPKLTLNPEADVIVNKTSLGEITDKREFNGNININKDKIEIKKLDYVKYVSSQDNTFYPILFATIKGKFNINEDNIPQAEEINIKTYKNLSAKILNILFKNAFFKQGSFNCDLKYKFNKVQKIAKLIGELNCENLDIPVFDTLVKNIRMKAKDDNINLHLFGFMNDSKISITSELDNNIYNIPELHLLRISAEEIDHDKLLQNIANIKQTVQKNATNENKNIDFSNLQITNGILDIKKFTLKSLTAENISTNFSIDKTGIFRADDINVNVGDGNIAGKLLFDINKNVLKGNFEVNNVDANYMAETLFDGKNQIYGNASGKMILETKGLTDEEIIKNLQGFMYFDISDGRMPKLGSLEYLLRAGNILKSGLTGLTLNSILELLNLVKTGYFSNINGSCVIENGIARDIEIFSKGENMSLYIQGTYDIQNTIANMEILGKLSKKISTIFGAVGNTSLNTFFKLIPGISMLDFSRKNFVEDVEKIPSFTNGDYESRIFQAIINGNINESGYVQSFKWVK